VRLIRRAQVIFAWALLAYATKITLSWVIVLLAPGQHKTKEYAP